MPDPNKETLSATEVPALFDASPYVTRWMLYQKFASGMDISSPRSDRMMWGTKLQPLVIAQVAEDKQWEVIANDKDHYARRGLLGCTRDAVIVCPDRGPGALEIKCVFDYRAWMNDWAGGQMVPRHHEIQLQTQMMVGGVSSFDWGMIAAWVCGEMHYFERAPIYTLWHHINNRAGEFFADVEAKREPDAFGAPAEAPIITALYPTVEERTLDLSADPDHVKTSEDVSMYATSKEIVAGNSRVVDQLRIRLLALAKDAQTVLLPCGVNYRVQRSGKGKTIVPFVPDTPLPAPPAKTEPTILAG